MLVEDDNNLREIYGERLMAEGYEIVSAGDGEEALALAVKEKPDLIISDVMMPKISGFDMLDILRQTPETKDTKVIMMTALSQTEDKDRADKLGADKYLVKSQVTLEDVARVVHDLIYGPDETQESSEASAGPETATQQPVVTAPIATGAVVSPELTSAATEPVASEPTATVPTTNNSIPVSADNEGEPIVLPPAPVVAPTEPVAPVPEPTAVVTPTLPDPTVATPAPEPVAAEPITPIAAASVTPTDSVAPDVPTPAPEPAVVPIVEPVTPPTAMPQATNEPVAVTTPELPPEAVASPAAEAPFVLSPADPQPAVATPEPIAAPTAVAPIVEPVTNPIAGSESTATSAVTDATSATAQSTEDETADIAKQIEDFVKSGLTEQSNTTAAPLVEPTEQELIHAQNAVEDPNILQPAVEAGIAATAANAPNNPSIPPVAGSDTNPEPASARKKVIAPINPEGFSGPNIYELYEKEMAQEAANSPVINPSAGSTLENANDTNPITQNTSQAPAAPLETIDASQIEGVTVGEEEPLLPPPPTTVPAETPQIIPDAQGTLAQSSTETEQKPDPNDPANFAL